MALLVFLRFSGKRSLAKMNAFDLVVTVALGSTLSSIITSNSVALVQCITALALLLLLQWLISWLSVRSGYVENLVKAQPTLLFYDGQILRNALRHERITEAELLACLRLQGLASYENVRAVVLETNGDISIIHRNNSGNKALRPVKGWPQKG